MVEIPNASDMKNLVNNEITKELEEVINKCVEAINISVRLKKLSTTFGLTGISSGVVLCLRQQLTKKGYKVEYVSNQRDGNYLNISWD